MRQKLIVTVIVIMLIISAILIFRPTNTHFSKVVVRVDGIVTQSLPLDENTKLTIETASGYNHLVIQNGTIFIDNADCPDHLCMQQGVVSPNNVSTRPLGPSLVCLPHRVTITME